MRLEPLEGHRLKVSVVACSGSSVGGSSFYERRPEEKHAERTKVREKSRQQLQKGDEERKDSLPKLLSLQKKHTTTHKSKRYTAAVKMTAKPALTARNVTSLCAAARTQRYHVAASRGDSEVTYREDHGDALVL